MTKIHQVRAREILDSRGNPTVEVDVILAGGAMGRAAVPSGASTGQREALELRDGGTRFSGRGVGRAVENVRGAIAQAIVGLDAGNQRALDRGLCELDGTENKSRLGANALLGVSMAAARAVAEARGLPLYESLGRSLDGAQATTLPVPLMNLINGGAHADNDLDVQEFMIVPLGAPDFAEALRAGAEVFHALKGLLRERGHRTNVGDEGGFAPELRSTEEALDLLCQAIERSGRRPGDEVSLAMDVAASELREGERYTLQGEALATSALVDRWEALCARYPIVSIEDGLAEDDWAGWTQLTGRLGGRIQVVGDDLLCTRVSLIERAVRERCCTAVLCKLNQIGTLSETLDAIATARAAGWGTVISHRSGETEDTFIADLAVATGAGQIKTGSLSRSDRVAKYNRLLRIAEELGSRARYAGRAALCFSRSG